MEVAEPAPRRLRLSNGDHRPRVTLHRGAGTGRPCSPARFPPRRSTMHRLALPTVLLLLSLSPALRADAFDHYINTVLAKAPGSSEVKKLDKLTTAELADHDGVLPGTPGVLLIVRTNDN